MSLITINSFIFDPERHIEVPLSEKPETKAARGRRHILIQTRTHLSEAEKKELAKLGVTIQEYVSENTYLCAAQNVQLDKINVLPYVIWTGTYPRRFKISPALTSNAPAGAFRLVDIILHADANGSTSKLKSEIARAARVGVHDLITGRRKIRCNTQDAYFDDIAGIEAVREIQPVPTRVPCNNVARSIINAHVVVNGTAYEGDGQVICIADSGFDRGVTDDVHPAFAGRVERLYRWDSPGAKYVPAGPTESGQVRDYTGHGTHVCGSALGDGFSASMGGAIQGTAPRARLIVQGNAPWLLPTDLFDLFQAPYTNDGVRVHSNSWASIGASYSNTAHEIDEFVWNHPDFVVCFSAANEGADMDANGVVDPSPIAGEAGAKNAVIVGASESTRASDRRPDASDFPLTYGRLYPSRFKAAPIQHDRIADNSGGMAAFSSRGPTREGNRIKPDVVAPGTSILSAQARDPIPLGDDHGKSKDPAFSFDSGTSMATPLVAGCAAVLRETLVKNGLSNPPAALIKALLINGARDLAGQYDPSEASPAPNNDSGWGLVDLAGSIILPGNESGVQLGGPLKEGEEDTFTITIRGSTLKITLVWTDPAGAWLQNDLDLIVTAADGSERHGNMGTSPDFDRLNNVEQILWPNIAPGQEKVTIRAHRIALYPQAYACAWKVTH